MNRNLGYCPSLTDDSVVREKIVSSETELDMVISSKLFPESGNKNSHSLEPEEYPSLINCCVASAARQ